MNTSRLNRLAIVSVLLSLTLASGCDDSSGAEKSDAAEATAQPKTVDTNNKLEALNAKLEKGEPFDAALSKVETQMGKSPLQQGEFWNFGEYDTSGACVHMVLVRGGETVQQVQFTKYEPGSSGFGWCSEMKIKKS